MLVNLDKFGRVLIPKRVRERLGIKPASALSIVDDGKRIILQPVNEEEALLQKDGLLIYTGDIRHNVMEELERNRTQRISRLINSGE